MLKELEKYYDQYTINARLMPAFLTTLPIVMTFYSRCTDCKGVIGTVFALLLFFGVMTLLSVLMSYLGNNVQNRLIKEWGGLPTTILLRHSDKTIDKYTKDRTHQWVNAKIHNLTLPTPEQERQNPKDADERYISAANFLREATRSKSDYPMVYRDNTAYGFCRNLLAVKPFGMAVSTLCIILNAGQLRPLWSSNVIGQIGVDDVIALTALVMAVSLFLAFAYFVNIDLVKTRAVRYATSLFETCSRIR